MEWIEVNLKTLRENEEIIVSHLLTYDLDGITIEDEKLLFDFSKKEHKADLVDRPESFSPYIIAKVFFNKEQYPSARKTLIDFIEKSKNDGVEIELSKEEELKDTNWATEWMRYYEILHIGNFAIVPKWKDYIAKDNEFIIKINPGLAFGTGDHATTAMCLEYMQKLNIDDKSVLDMGCGSGILSIGAEKYGAASVLAADYDSEAIEKTLENIQLNDCKRIKTVESDLTTNIEGKFDFAMVNIIAEIIVNLLKDLHEYLNPGADVVFSGILEEKEELMREALKERYEIVEINRKDGWLAIGAKCIDVSQTDKLKSVKA